MMSIKTTDFWDIAQCSRGEVYFSEVPTASIVRAMNKPRAKRHVAIQNPSEQMES
jgi:hypothetical protein